MPKRPPQHRPAHWKPQIERKRERDAQRPNATDRGYDHRWQKARKIFISKNPLCVKCRADNHIVAASVVDHIIPHKGDQRLFWDITNWQSLCKTHHDQKTMNEGSFGQ